MTGDRRIVLEVSHGMTHPMVTSEKLQCRATIVLDGKTYRCRRHVAHVDGIHDAFARHADGGAVRW